MLILISFLSPWIYFHYKSDVKLQRWFLRLEFCDSLKLFFFNYYLYIQWDWFPVYISQYCANGDWFCLFWYFFILKVIHCMYNTSLWYIIIVTFYWIYSWWRWCMARNFYSFLCLWLMVKSFEYVKYFYIGTNIFISNIVSYKVWFCPYLCVSILNVFLS